MKYVDEFRDAGLAEQLLERIRSRVTRRWVIMEVCGGQTHSLLRYGIDVALEDKIELVHGPGCPVCVTDRAFIDGAVRLSFEKDVVVATFGDMLRVPGSSHSLTSARSLGGNVREFYSPSDAVIWASQHREVEVVFFAVGFETTAPATALALMQARELGLSNFSVLASHVRVIPAMESILNSPDNRVQGFLAAGHVCAVTGSDVYEDFVARFQVPVVVTGFEPIDLLLGIEEVISQLESGEAAVKNCYGRTVSAIGNRHAQDLVAKVYRPVDRGWRGMGIVAAGGFELNPEFASFDASRRFPRIAVDVGLLPKSTQLEERPAEVNGALSSSRQVDFQRTLEVVNDCRAGEVLSGRIKPSQCPEFGKRCHPEHPLGAPMVSSEGACAAWYRYRSRDRYDLIAESNNEK